MSKAHWIGMNVDLIKFVKSNLNDRWIATIWEWYQANGQIDTKHQLVLRQMIEAQPEYFATQRTAVFIPNGVFRVKDGSKKMEVKIHTVPKKFQNAGKRVVSYRGQVNIENHWIMTNWQPIGFLTSLGNVKVWRQFDKPELSEPIRFIQGALDLIKTFGRHKGSIHFKNWWVEISSGCLRCNMPLNNPESLYGPHCAKLVAQMPQPIKGVSQPRKSPSRGSTATKKAPSGQLTLI